MGNLVDKTLSSGIPSGNASKKVSYSSKSEGKIIKTFSQEEKGELMNSKIWEIIVGYEIMIHNFINKVDYFFYEKTHCYHASALLHTDKDKWILIEYGGYKGQKDSYDNYLYYPQESGLRFCFMEKDSYIRKKLGESTLYSKCRILKYGISLQEIINKIISKSNWSALDYRLITHDCQTFLCELVKITEAQLHSSTNEFWKYSLLRKDSAFRVLEALSEMEKKHFSFKINLYPGYNKVYLAIKRAKSQNDLIKIIQKEKEKNLPEYIITKIKRDINQKHPTFNRGYDINDKEEILNSIIEKIEIFYIKENNEEYISCLIKCKYTKKLVLLNYGKNGFDNYINKLSDFSNSFYSVSLFHIYDFHNNDSGIRFCFVESGIKLSFKEFKYSIPQY